MRKIFSASNITEAHLIKGLLEQEGIAAEVSGGFLQGGFGELPVVDMISVCVSKEDEQRALAIVKQYENSEVVDEQTLSEQAMQQKDVDNNE